MECITTPTSAQYDLLLSLLSPTLQSEIRRDEPLWRHTTLRVGGPADLYFRATNADGLAQVAAAAQRANVPCFVLGGGSNVCVSDRGVRGLVLHNLTGAREIDTITRVDSGYAIMNLFMDTAHAGLSGLEFAVGIPGSIGGALVSNAGAYRASIGPLVVDLDVVENGERKTVGADWMGFEYRNSRLRKHQGAEAVLVGCRLQLTVKPREQIMAAARENQRQRIYKQPWYPSAGSFFKNVYDKELAASLSNLPPSLKDAGVVPAGYLNAACGCKGLAVGGAQISERHGNFMVNRGGATASDIRALANLVRAKVQQAFGVTLEEEVLYVGDWRDS